MAQSWRTSGVVALAGLLVAGTSLTAEAADQPAVVEVFKTVSGVGDDEAWSFDFVISPVPAGEVAIKPASGSGEGSAGVFWSGLVPGENYTITEVVQPGFDAGAMACTGADDLDGDLADAGVEFQAPSGAGTGLPDVACSIVNTVPRPAVVEVFKSVEGVGDDEAWSFDFVISPVPAGEAAIKPASGTGDSSAGVFWSGLVPGENYTITEVVQPGFDAGAMACTGADDLDGDLADAGVEFQAPSGAGTGLPDVACSIVNTVPRPAVVEVFKSVEGVGDDEAWSFDFVISPVPAGEAAIKPASGTGDSSAGVSWSGLVPGENYTITEVVQPGFDAGAMACTGADDLDGDLADAGVEFQAPSGAGTGLPDVACSIVNTALEMLGCSHGYWGNHLIDWPAGYSHRDHVVDYFGATHVGGTTTLEAALRARGGGGERGAEMILLRQAVAALLNEAAYGTAYGPYATVEELVSAVDGALAGERSDMIELAGELDGWNNGVCR